MSRTLKFFYLGWGIPLALDRVCGTEKSIENYLVTGYIVKRSAHSSEEDDLSQREAVENKNSNGTTVVDFKHRYEKASLFSFANGTLLCLRFSATHIYVLDLLY